MKRAGFVLIGGRSSRMGRDKASLPYRGGVLAQAVAREVEAAAGQVALIGGAAPQCIPDLYPGEGPLGGILTALDATTADWNLIVACDMPKVTAAFLRELFDCAERWDVDVLLPGGPSHQVEPLCAVYHSRARQTLHTAFQSGIRKITAALEGLRTAVLLAPDAIAFQNVNTPEDWAQYVAG